MSYQFTEKMTNHQHELQITEGSWSRKEWVLPFSEMGCNIFETIYFNPSPSPSSTEGEGEGWDGREEL